MLLNIVCLSLDSDPTLEPRSAKTEATIRPLDDDDDDDDPDGRDTPTQGKGKAATNSSDTPDNPTEAEADEEDDDFIIMSEKQAKRIVSLTKASFDVDLSMDVVVAEPNVTALARRVMGARSLKEGG